MNPLTIRRGASVIVVGCWVALGAVAVAANDEKAPRGAVDAFLEAWTFKDYEALYPMLDASNREEVSRRAFPSAMESRIKDLEKANVVSFREEKKGQWVARVILSGTDPRAGQAKDTRYTLRAVREGEGANAKWHIRLPDLMASASAPGGAGPAGASVSSASGQTKAPAGFPESVVVDGLSLDDVLNRLAEADKKIQSMTANVHIAGSLIGQKMNQRGTLALKKPNLFKFDMGLLLVASNGLQTILYIPAANAYTTEAGKDSGLGLDLGLGGDTSKMKQDYHLALIGKEEAGERKSYKIAARPKKSGLFGDGVMTIWVDAKTWSPARAAFSSAMGHLDMRYQNVRINPPNLPDSTFRFTPPAGAMQLSGGMMGLR